MTISSFTTCPPLSSTLGADLLGEEGRNTAISSGWHRISSFSLTFLGKLLNSQICTGGSFSGRTTGSGPVNQGSNPCPPAIFLYGLFHAVIKRLPHHRMSLRYLFVVPSSSGLGYRPLTPKTGVRFPLGLPDHKKGFSQCETPLFFWSRIFRPGGKSRVRFPMSSARFVTRKGRSCASSSSTLRTGRRDSFSMLLCFRV